MASASYTHLPLPLAVTGKPKRPTFSSNVEAEKANTENRKQHSKKLVDAASRISRGHKQSLEQREDPEAHPIPAGIPLILRTEPNIDLDFLRSVFQFEIVAEAEDGFILVASEDIDLKLFMQKAQEFAIAIRGSGAAAKVYELIEDQDDRQSRLKRVLSERLHAIWSNLDESELVTVDLSIACSGTKAPPEFRERTIAETDEEFAERTSKYKTKLASLANGAKPPGEPKQRLEESQEDYAKWYARYEERKIQWWEEFDQLMMKREEELTNWVVGYGGQVLTQTNAPHFPDCFQVRAILPFKGLRDIVYNHPHLFEVGEPEEIGYLETGTVIPDSERYPTVESPSADSPLVAVLDSGIQESHPLIGPAVQTGFSISFVPGDSSVADLVSPNGHGTRVAGTALYRSGIAPGIYRLPFRVVNIRVLDRNGNLPEELVPQDYIGRAVKHAGPSARIFNHSVASKDGFEPVHMSSWAASIDLVSYTRDVLFVQAAGNLRLNDPGLNTRSINHYLQDGVPYPDYLLERACRIANPGHSFQALTVGSISADEWAQGDRRSFGGKHYPSAFTSTGPGLWDCIKPDVVELGGCLSLDSASPPGAAPHAKSSLDLVRAQIGGGDYRSRDGFGTSFAAPLVTGLLAEIERLLPGEPTLTYRALVANAARWPDWAERWLRPADILRFLGYGIPSAERALENTDYRVTLITSGTREIGGTEAHIFRIPIPPELRNPSNESSVRIDVTLSYCARPRRTRRNPRGYLSTWLDWKASCKEEGYDSFGARIMAELDGGSPRDGGKELAWMLREDSRSGIVRQAKRSVGTLQKDWAIAPAHELPTDLCIAVVGHKGWDKNSEDKAKYTLVVSLESLGGEISLYAPIEAAIQSLVELPVEVTV